MINPIGLAGFCLLSALSPDNDRRERASRPFDRTRNGFVLGEGAGFLVLEEWSGAMRRGARIYAELAGDASSISSYRMTDSPLSGDGPIQAMRRALESAGTSASEVDYVNAHGTSTPMNDRSEAAALRAVFGIEARRIAVSSTKSSMGHLIAAAAEGLEALRAGEADRALAIAHDSPIEPERILSFATLGLLAERPRSLAAARVRPGAPRTAGRRVRSAWRVSRRFATSDNSSLGLRARGNARHGATARRLAAPPRCGRKAPALGREARRDEATSAIDGDAEGQIFSRLTAWLARRGVIVMARRLSTVSRFPRVVVLGDGRVLGDGASAELARTCFPYQTLFAEQLTELPARAS